MSTMKVNQIHNMHSCEHLLKVSMSESGSKSAQVFKKKQKIPLFTDVFSLTMEFAGQLLIKINFDKQKKRGFSSCGSAKWSFSDAKQNGKGAVTTMVHPILKWWNIPRRPSTFVPSFPEYPPMVTWGWFDVPGYPEISWICHLVSKDFYIFYTKSFETFPFSKMCKLET